MNEVTDTKEIEIVESETPQPETPAPEPVIISEAKIAEIPALVEDDSVTEGLRLIEEKHEIELSLAGKWKPTKLHVPFWGISDGKPHEFVMRQGGIVSMTHVSDPDGFMERALKVQDGLAAPIHDAGIYAPTEALITQYLAK